MRWLVGISLTLAQAQLLQRYTEEGRQVSDLLHGFSFPFYREWEVKVLGNMLVISHAGLDGFIRIGGMRYQSSVREVVQRWLSEKRITGGSYAKYAFRQVPQGYLLLAENLSFPYHLSPGAIWAVALQNKSLPTQFREVTAIFPSKGLALVVSFLYAEGSGPDLPRKMQDIVQKIKFLPLEQRISWKEVKVLDPEVGMEAQRLHIPKDWTFQGSIRLLGAKRLPVWSANGPGYSVRHDAIEVSTTVLQSGYGGPGSSQCMVNLNGQAFQLPQPIWLQESEDVVKIVTSLIGQASGSTWEVVEVLPLPLSEAEQALAAQAYNMATGLAAMGVQAMPQTLKLAYLARSGQREQIGFISGTFMSAQSPHALVAQYSQSLNALVRSIQFPAGQLERAIGILGGIGASEYTSPEWGLSALERFSADHRALNRMTREMVEGHRRFNSEMATTWSNLLSDQTYVRDPQTQEVFRLHKYAWETGNFWREPVFGDVLMQGVEPGSRLEELLRTQGWKPLQESLAGFPE